MHGLCFTDWVIIQYANVYYTRIESLYMYCALLYGSNMSRRFEVYFILLLYTHTQTRECTKSKSAITRLVRLSNKWFSQKLTQQNKRKFYYTYIVRFRTESCCLVSKNWLSKTDSAKNWWRSRNWLGNNEPRQQITDSTKTDLAKTRLVTKNTDLTKTGETFSIRI